MATNSLEINVATVTPIWTGGPDGKSDRLRITSIMGGLRWWYEAIIRGIGGNACDPYKHPCLYDSSKPPYFGLCDVCQIFGATGWARRFKINIIENKLKNRKPVASSIDASGRRIFTLSSDYTVTPKPRWYLSGDPLYGDFTLQIIATAPLDKEGNQGFDPKVIGALIQFIANWASLGAKPQMGLGVVRLIDPQSTVPLLAHLRQIIEMHETLGDKKSYEYYDGMPSLHNMFFASVKVDQAHTTESSTFDLKYDLRAMFRKEFGGDNNLRHAIMGIVQGEHRQGAKIMMSYPDSNGTIRIWGWIPKIAGSHPSRNEILNNIYDFLEDAYGNDFDDWLNFNSARYEDMLKYLEQGLLKEAK